MKTLTGFDLQSKIARFFDFKILDVKVTFNYSIY